MDTDLHHRLEFALRAAREAGELILGHYRDAELAVDLKGDLSPVTAADRGAEELLRERIARTFPDDGVLGEEFGEKESSSGWRWILDPVDGTKAFVSGVPLFGTLIGLESAGDVVLGVCRFPALDEVVYAASGTGAWWQAAHGSPRRARVSDVASLSDALFCFTEVEGWHAVGRFDAFDRICRTAKAARGWGDCYGHALVATGRADLMIDPRMNPWDIAPLIPILQEAGGRHVGWDGNASIHSPNAVSANPALLKQALEMLDAGEAVGQDSGLWKAP